MTTAKDAALALRDTIEAIAEKLLGEYGHEKFSSVGSEKELFRLLGRSRTLINDVINSIGVAVANLAQ